jgi:hypothetical protein
MQWGRTSAGMEALGALLGLNSSAQMCDNLVWLSHTFKFYPRSFRAQFLSPYSRWAPVCRSTPGHKKSLPLFGL